MAELMRESAASRAGGKIRPEADRLACRIPASLVATDVGDDVDAVLERELDETRDLRQSPHLPPQVRQVRSQLQTRLIR